MDIRIIVVTHKDYAMPGDDMYLPVCVGAGRDALRGKFQPDDQGDNISEKNGAYCELTGLYWAWKHLTNDYIGLNHYRRYFSAPDSKGPMQRADMEALLKRHAIILPQKRRYPFYTMESHYCRSVRGYGEIHRRDIAMLRQAVSERAPDYREALNETLSSSGAHMLNMFVMSREKFDAYCAWLFPILDRAAELLRERADQRRYIGALSELLPDVWLRKNGWDYAELPVYETEKRSFGDRLGSFIARKLRG